MEKTFLLGVGAQKAGTTWLYDSLGRNDKVCFGITKEYHIWDAVYSKGFENLLVNKDDVRLNLDLAAIRHNMRNEKGYYERYFNEIISSGFTLTGDITPSYSMLSANDFKNLREQLEGINARICVVFLMRDPFERCWSAARMSKRLLNINLTDEAFLLHHYSKRGFRLRTRYDWIVENLRAAFSNDELYFGVYETMHTEPELQRLSRFLGVSIDKATIHAYANTSLKSEKISHETKALVNGYYREVYEFCWNAFPDTKLNWQL